MAITNNVKYLINEGEDVTLQVISEVNTTGLTVSARYRVQGGTGTGTQFGTVAGSSAGTTLSLSCDFSGLAVGSYDVEIYADYGGASQQLLLPNNDETLIFQIVDRFAI